MIRSFLCLMVLMSALMLLKGQAQASETMPYRITPASVLPSVRAEQSPDEAGRLVEIPDDFVVMVGETVTGSTHKDRRYVSTYDSESQEHRSLMQGEEVSLQRIETNQLASRGRPNKIRPDPLPSIPHSAKDRESPLTEFRGSSVTSASVNNVLTEYRALTKADFDPFRTLVSWRFESGTRVGDAVQQLATFIGYHVRVDSPAVGAIYAMELPYVHRSVKHLKVQTAFEMIGGAGMFVVVDHRKREIMHYVKALGQSESGLPSCFELGFVEWESPTAGYCARRDKRCRL